jgi:1A family penicillin-binding protein
MPEIDSYHKGKKPDFWTRLKLLWFRKKYKSRPQRKIIKKVFIFCIWLVIIGFICVIGVFAYFAKDLPNPEELTERRIIESTKIYDRTGEILLYDVHGEEKRTVIPFEEIPQNLKNATIVIEDTNFYHHFGLDFKGILRAFLTNLQGKKVGQGGSTITQQLIKNTILSPERTYARKIREAILAIELEIKYTKEEILGFYLNQVPYGSNAYGIEAASQTFFNKNAKNLTLAESALLAALTQAPSYYSPHGSHLTELKARQEYILERMYKFGYITEEEFKNAKQEELKFAQTQEKFKAPHFVMYIKEYLEDKYGKEYVEKAGLKVYTTLDWDLQKIAETIVSEQVKKNAKNYNAYNAALVAIDPKTGQILSMVGSRDYFAPESLPKGCKPGKNCLFEPNVNVAIRPRQPGSSFKPFAYAKAFQKGFTPDTVVFDLETEFAVEGAESYKPRNYDGKFRGPVTFRQGLAQSLNIPSVKVLYLAGVSETINLAQDMGINTLKDRSRYGLSLVLGGGEVKLLEETAAFGVFTNDGIKNPVTSILKIENNKGTTIEEYENKSQKIIEPQIARLISDILSDDDARAPIFGSKSNLYIEGIPTAAKTGTTQEYRDGWTIGYTPSLVVGVWAGNNDNTPMNKEPGLIVAAPIWNQFIKQAYEIKKIEQVEEFIEPEQIITNKDILNNKFANELKIKIDKISGKLATNLTPPDLIEEKTYYQVHCLLYYVNKDDPQGENNGRDDPQFSNWEAPVISWALTPERAGLYNQEPPQEYDDIHIPGNQPSITIIGPSNNETIDSNPVKIEAEAYARLGIEKLEFFFDDDLIGVKYQRPYSLYFNVPQSTQWGGHTIEVRAIDIVGNFSVQKIKINLFNFSY